MTRAAVLCDRAVSAAELSRERRRARSAPHQFLGGLSLSLPRAYAHARGVVCAHPDRAACPGRRPGRLARAARSAGSRGGRGAAGGAGGADAAGAAACGHRRAARGRCRGADRRAAPRCDRGRGSARRDRRRRYPHRVWDAQARGGPRAVALALVHQLCPRVGGAGAARTAHGDRPLSAGVGRSLYPCADAGRHAETAPFSWPASSKRRCRHCMRGGIGPKRPIWRRWMADDPFWRC